MDYSALATQFGGQPVGQNYDDLAKLFGGHSAAPDDPATRYARALKDAQAQQMSEMGTGQRTLAGAGKAFVDLKRGAGQILGLEDQKGIDEARQLDAPLMSTPGGVAGNVLGNIAVAAPTMMIPGANTVVGAGLVGGALNGLQPTADGESRLQNVVAGAALGAGAQAGIGTLAQFLAKRATAAQAAGATSAAQNAVKDATLTNAQAAGYVVPPSMAGGGVLSRVLEGVSGKAKTNQAMSIKNQGVTDGLVRKSLGLPEDAPLTGDSLQALRDQAYQKGYEPLANAGAVETDTLFDAALNKIASDYQGAARSFPNAVKDDVGTFVNGMKTGVFDVGDALKMTRVLREQASSAYAAGNQGVGKASREASKAIEDQIERALQASGQNGADLLQNFQNARQLIAKSHNVQDALIEGGGKVNARVLGAALQRGAPLSGDLKTIGAFANNFRDVTGVPQSGWGNPITALDAFGTAGMGALGAGPMALALPSARLASRYLLLSQPYQRALAERSYGPGLLASMAPEALKKAGSTGFPGLLGSSIYAAQ